MTETDFATKATTEGAAETPAKTDTVSFGAGCFWQVEAAFREVEGVTDTAVGYEGGSVPNPTYEQVCTGATGHAEVTQVTFDPEKVSFDELLELYWKVHDPTQVDRQGPDIGTQYRSVIFTNSDEQKAAAEASKERQAGQAPQADRDHDRADHRLLHGRGLPPVLPREAQVAEWPDGDVARALGPVTRADGPGSQARPGPGRRLPLGTVGPGCFVGG